MAQNFADRRLALIRHNSKDELIDLFKHEKDVRRRERLHALCLGYEDADWKNIAATLFHGYDTVIAWVHAYNGGGLAAVGIKPIPGRPSKLNKEQREALAKAVDSGPLESGMRFANWTAKGFTEWLAGKFDVTLSVSGLTELLHRLGFSWRMPDHRYVGANCADRVRFAERIVRTVAAMEPRDMLLLADEMTVDKHPKLTRTWMRRGAPKRVPTSGTHEKRHVFGLVNPFTGLVVSRVTKRNRAIHFVGVLAQALRTYPGRLVYVVLDNGPAHTAKVVQRFLAAHPRLVPLWLPKYSSDLNGIEEFWKPLRREVTHNRFFPEMDDAGKALRAFLSRVPRETVMSVSSMDYLLGAR